MKTNRALYLVAMLAALALFVALPCWRVPTALAADHREAPVVDSLPEGDITDVYAFVSPADSSKVVFIMNVNPFSVPAENPSYSLSPDFLYQFKIDTTGNAREDLVIQVAVEGTGQTQTVRVFGPARPEHTGARNRRLKGAPSAQGTFGSTLTGTNGLRAFVGLRDDPFTFDVSQFFRILNSSQDVFRQVTSPALGALRGRPIRADGTSGVDGFGGFNVTSIVVEVPKSAIQRGNSPNVNVWATVSQRLDDNEQEEGKHEGHVYKQFERMGQQVFATVFIPKGTPRDLENEEIPEHDVANYSSLIPDTLTTTDTDGTGNTIAGRATVLNAVGVTALPNGVPLILPATFANSDKNLLRKVLLPDVLRLNLAAPATDVGVFSNGLQNGRRPGDSVVDIGLLGLRQLADVHFPAGTGLPGSGALGSRIALDCTVLPACPDRRVLVVLQGTTFNKPDAQLSDLSKAGNDAVLPLTFPFLADPHPLP